MIWEKSQFTYEKWEVHVFKIFYIFYFSSTEEIIMNVYKNQ